MLSTIAQPEQSHSNAQDLQDGFRAGWAVASVWAIRDDLLADIGSPAYLKDMAKVLSINAVEPSAEAAWQTTQALPEVPMQWIEVQEVNLYRFLPYKPNSTEFKRGKKGRWQRHSGYGFENAEPQAGPWRVTAGQDDAGQQAA